ncbi:hypothetical protein [Microbispora sp. CA-102843]|uniref:hypothetical protein n=1 Tax=Microbispora sp. CA-102843 TaxID=3239952 RepID=UPI003D8C3F74
MTLPYAFPWSVRPRRPNKAHGGFEHSGYGKDLSMYEFEDYTRIKHVMSNIDL